MAIDVIIRDQEGVFTLVGDMDTPIPEKISICGNKIYGLLANGFTWNFGYMTESMTRLAAACQWGAMVIMDGPTVRCTIDIPFEVSET